MDSFNREFPDVCLSRIGSSQHNSSSMLFHIPLISLEQFGPTFQTRTMNFPTPEAIFSFLDWRAAEEDYDAEFLEECALKFEAGRESLLHNAKIYRQKAQNIRAILAFLRGDELE
jgi:hypothetical protein